MRRDVDHDVGSSVGHGDDNSNVELRAGWLADDDDGRGSKRDATNDKEIAEHVLTIRLRRKSSSPIYIEAVSRTIIINE